MNANVFQTYFWIGVQKFFYHAEFFAFFPFTSSVVCVCTFYSEKEKKILKFAYNYSCLNVFMNYIFQRVWSGLVIQILSLPGFAQINCCLVAVKGYFFWKSKIQNNDCVPFWISWTNGLTNYFFFLYLMMPLKLESWLSAPMVETFSWMHFLAFTQYSFSINSCVQKSQENRKTNICFCTDVPFEVSGFHS